MIGENEVAIILGEPAYPTDPPYSPTEVFPEYPFGSFTDERGVNHAYSAVRAALKALQLDASSYEHPQWNPLGALIGPGDTVVVKPNFVRDFTESGFVDAECLIAHGSVIRAVVDYVFIALQGHGRIVIADAPQNDADFAVIRRITGIDEIQRFYGDSGHFNIDVYDLRQERAHKVDGVIVGHAPLTGDPKGYARVDLGRSSALAEISHLCHLLYGAEYDTGGLRKHHHADTHEYLISGTVLNADVVISVPKLKTHKKVGLTVNMKNLVGINGDKNWLPHYREGTPSQGGDQFPTDGMRRKVERAVVTSFKRWFPLLGGLRPLIARPAKGIGKRLFGDTNRGTTRSGNWYGNDTAWRMVLDLNRILFYADRDGRLHDRPVRKFLSIVDGIVSGEGKGPLDPTPKPTGVVLAGINPVAVDLACARVMGFDYRRIPLLFRALADHPLRLAAFGFEDVVARSNDQRFDGPLAEMRGPLLDFEPHFGWKGHIEIGESTTTDERGTPCVG